MSTTPHSMIEVTIEGGHTVTVPQGGFYDRYRMNPDLDAIARDPLVSGVDFFRKLPKTQIESPLGHAYTPNFYYRASTARLTMLARSSAIRARLPRELAPLEVVPGVGVIYVMFLRYDVCDIDPYNEVVVAAVVKSAQHSKLGLGDFLAGISNNHFYTHILSLPVTTDIACIIGRERFGLPKWRTDIDIDITTQHTSALVSNDDGQTDLFISTATPKQTRFTSGKHISTSTIYSQLNENWQSTLLQTNILSAGNKLFPRNITLRTGTGTLTNDLRSLKILTTLHLEVSTNSQIALHLPAPIATPQP